MDTVTVRHLYSHPAAYMAKAKLEAEEIPSFLADEYIVGVNWLWARAVSGIRLIVAGEFGARANEILDRDDSSMLEGISEWQQPPSRYECCPACRSGAVLAPRLGRNARVLSLSLWLPVFIPAVLAWYFWHQPSSNIRAASVAISGASNKSHYGIL